MLRYSGTTSTTDKLFKRVGAGYAELFAEPENRDAANYVAGRSCACVDRFARGTYGVMVANYGGPMRLYEWSGRGMEVGRERPAAPENGREWREPFPTIPAAHSLSIPAA